MKTFRLWLEPDCETPRLKRLAYEQTPVSVADVLQKGIHPWDGTDANGSLSATFCDRLNADDALLPGLKEMGYSAETSPSPSIHYYDKTTQFEETLERVRANVFFAEGLTFPELLGLAKQRLRGHWINPLAQRLLRSAHPSFDGMRSFLKTKDEDLKVASYAEIEMLDLKHILSLDDFEGEDSLLIAEGIPSLILRQESALAKVTDERGLLRLAPSIRDFQLTVTKPGDHTGTEVTYNCTSDGHSARLLPCLTTIDRQRRLSGQFAARWRKDKGRYCFTTDIASLEGMASEAGCQFQFATLAYGEPREGRMSTGKLSETRAERFTIGKIINHNASGETLRAVLRWYKVSMTGRKEELVEKLARLTASEYEKAEPALGTFFRKNRFLRLSAATSPDSATFPVLPTHTLRNTLLMMYALRHLRGNVILEASHVNDTFDLLPLAKALIKGEVTVQGEFMRVA